jgi:hypothetical protein
MNLICRTWLYQSSTPRASCHRIGPYRPVYHGSGRVRYIQTKVKRTSKPAVKEPVYGLTPLKLTHYPSKWTNPHINEAYPPNLLVYNSGTIRTFTVAAVKVTILVGCLANLYAFTAKHVRARSIPDPIEAIRSESMLTIAERMTDRF